MEVVIVKYPGSDDELPACDVAAMWMSVKAATVFATTFTSHQAKNWAEVKAYAPWGYCPRSYLAVVPRIHCQ